MIQPTYNCSQSGLYQASRNIAQSLSDNLSDFTAFKGKYIAAFVTALNASITAAENLPDFQARSAQSEVDYINLGSALTVCTNQWQNLKRYITEAYPPEVLKPRLEEAGSLYYERAIQKNWDSAKSLLQSAANFITLHQTVLEGGLNMPTTFKADFDANHLAFTDALLAFQQGEEEIKVGTETKIQTNNTLFDSIMSICLDGQQIYRTNQALKDQFTFTTVIAIVSGIGTTGFKGYVTDSVTGNPIAGAIVSASPNGKAATTDPSGFYDLKQMSAGIYLVNVTAAGYQPFNNPAYQVDAGIQHNLSIQLIPV